MRAPLSRLVFLAAGIVLLAAAAISAGGAAGAEGTGSQGVAQTSTLLDGKTFLAQAGEKGKDASIQDTIVFREGRFLSEGCLKWNFGDAAYRAEIEGGGIRFRAETQSPTHGAMVWEGIVKGDTIEATSIWTRERWYWKIKREYWFRGQLKQ